MNRHEVKELAGRHGLHITEDTITLNESGLDFTVAHVENEEGEKWILRIPRRTDSMRNAEQEKHVLDVVNHYTTIQAPDWKVFTNELIAYEQLAGVLAATIDPEIQNYVWSFDVEKVPDVYHQSLGRLLADLHKTPTSLVTASGIAIDPNGSEAREAMKSRMKKIKDTFGVQQDLWERWQDWVSNDAFWPEHTGLSHGDVHPGHLLINQNDKITGLIDWTEAAVTDVSRDFVSHYLIFGEAGLEKVIDAYENAGGQTWAHMKAHIIELETTSAISVAEFAQSSGIKEMEDMAKQMLGVME